MAMTGRRGTSGRVNMTRLLVLAVGAVVIGGNTVTVHGAEAAKGPFAFDGGAELCHELGIGWRGCCAQCGSAGGDKLFDVGYFLGGELGGSLVVWNKVVEHSLFVGSCKGQGIHPLGELFFKGWRSWRAKGTVGESRSRRIGAVVPDCSGGRTKGVAKAARGKLLTVDGELGFSGPLFPCWPDFGGWKLGIPHYSLGGKLAAMRRDLEAVATSHLLVMGKLARRAFFCTSSSLLIYSGTRVSSSHHDWMSMKKETMSVASNPAKVVARCPGVTPCCSR
jgi:hypothetical protein